MAALVRHALPDWAAIEWLSETGSTNSDLLEQARAGLPQPRLRGCHLQLQGRGRANRNFRAAPGQTLMFSCGFATTLPIAALPTLSVYFGLLACETVAGHLPPGHQLDLKWPNDLQWRGAKLAGLLMETTNTPDGDVRVVIGMGLNLRGAADLSQALGRPIADWSHTAAATSATELCVAVARAWQRGVTHTEAEWRPQHGLPGLSERYALHDALAGRPIVVKDNNVVLKQGVAAGITPYGALLLQNEAGRETIYAGDVSVRAL